MTAATIPGLDPSSAPTKHQGLLAWITEIAELTQPDRVVWSDGSDEEWERLTAALVKAGTLVKLNEEKKPNSFLASSDPADVARVESRTYICSESEEDAGPTNNWVEPAEMRATMTELYRGSMRGRTMFVIPPFCMGPLDSDDPPKLGVEITDSEYVVLSMKIMTRVGPRVLELLGDDGFFVKALHSVGAPPLEPGQADVPWPCNTEKYITLPGDPRDLVVRFGLRRQRAAREEVLRPAHRVGHRSRRGLDGRAHAHPQADQLGEQGLLHRRGLPECLWQDESRDAAAHHSGLEGRDRRRRHRWMRFGEDGRLYAINPEFGFFGVAPGTSYDSNPNAMKTIEAGNTLYTNVARTDDGDIWWEGIDGPAPAHLTDWLGNDWTRSPITMLPTRTRVTAPRSHSARRWPTSGTTRRACRSRRSCSAAVARRPSRW